MEGIKISLTGNEAEMLLSILDAEINALPLDSPRSETVSNIFWKLRKELK